MEQIVEVALRSLSPGINDPFTARICVDRIGQALTRFARMGMPEPGRRDEQGRLRLITNPPEFHCIVETAFDQLRQNVMPHVAVVLRMLETIELTARFCKTNERKDPLLCQARLIMQLAQRQVDEPHDLAAVRRQFESTQRQLLNGGETESPCI